MRFTYILLPEKELPGLQVALDKDSDNLYSINEKGVAPNAYFSCGDLVVNYDQLSGEVISLDGYLPYFEGLPHNQKLTFPEDAVPARFLVGNLTGSDIFSIDQLPLELSGANDILHAGAGESDSLLAISPRVVFGLQGDALADIYLKLKADA